MSKWNTLGHVLNYRQKIETMNDTLQNITEIIQVNEISWKVLFIMLGIMMLGALLYNLWHAREFFFKGFNPITLVKQNYMRFIWVLSISFVFCLILQLIPGVNDYINSLIAFQFEFSSLGLLILGGFISKIAFTKVKKNEPK